MYTCYQEALDNYSDYNKHHVEHIIIFRDGVGDAMRHQVLSEELNLLHTILKEKYSIHTPKVTLIIVNKRINQRFFQQTQ